MYFKGFGRLPRLVEGRALRRFGPTDSRHRRDGSDRWRMSVVLG